MRNYSLFCLLNLASIIFLLSSFATITYAGGCSQCREICGVGTSFDRRIAEDIANQSFGQQVRQICGPVQTSKTVTKFLSCQVTPHAGGSNRLTCGFCARACEINSPSGGSSTGNASSQHPKLYDFKYTIRNTTKVNVKFRLPSGKVYTLRPNQKRNYFIKKILYKKPKIYVLTTGRRYTLKPGNHKFWWNKKANRVGLDQRYDTE